MTLKPATLPAKKPLTYAEAFNARFNQQTSVFLSVEQRIKNTLKHLPAHKKAVLEAIIDEFKRRFKGVAFKDLKFAESILVPLSDIVIDDTMQRMLDWDHLTLDILSNFRPTMVMPVNVYVDKDNPSKFTAWDGQHTVAALYIIAVMIYGLNPKKVMIPVNKFCASQKNEIRENFIRLNGDAKKPLDPVDIIHQMICGVRIDGSDDPVWVEAELKQQYLEKAGLFLTSKKFDDDEEVGAITGVAEINSLDAKIVEKFAVYWLAVGQERPLPLKEIKVIGPLLELLDKEGLLTDKYIKDMVAVFKENFDCNFDGSTGPFFARLQVIYDDWYNTYYAALIDNLTKQKKSKKEMEALLPKRWTLTSNSNYQTEAGLKFIFAQLAADKNFKHRVPTYVGDHEFQITTTALWD